MPASNTPPTTIDKKNTVLEEGNGTTKESTDNKNTIERTKKDSEVDIIKILTLILSTLSFIIALGAFYYSQLAPPAISLYIGRNVEVYYPKDGGFGLYLPITAVNAANNTGAIRQISISLSKADSNNNYFFNWVAYSVTDKYSNSWQDEEIINPIVLAGKSSLSKTIWFVWRPWAKPDLILTPGTYILRVFSMSDPDKQLELKDEKTFTLDAQNIGLLNQRRADHDNLGRAFLFNENDIENGVFSEEKLKEKVRGL